MQTLSSQDQYNTSMIRTCSSFYEMFLLQLLHVHMHAHRSTHTCTCTGTVYMYKYICKLPHITYQILSLLYEEWKHLSQH